MHSGDLTTTTVVTVTPRTRLSDLARRLAARGAAPAAGRHAGRPLMPGGARDA